jgi:FkbM family methyltransferase
MLEESGGVYEPHIMCLLRGLVKPDFVCIDIGANVGALSLAMGSYAQSGRVFAFEASKQSFAFLGTNISQSGLSNVSSVNKAVWNHNGMIEFNCLVDEPGGSFVGGFGRKAGSRTKTIQVEAIRLDDWINAQNLNRVDLLKVDVEGGERRVLLGALEALRQFQPDCLLEFYPACMDVFFQENPLDLYRLLREEFRSIYIIQFEPDGYSLLRVNRYADLYSYVRRGKGLTDLLCTHRPDAEIERLAPVRRLDDQFFCTYINRYDDGWSADNYAEIVCFSRAPTTRLLRLRAGGPRPAVVNVVSGDVVHRRVINPGSFEDIELALPAGESSVVIETERTFVPRSEGLGDDPRNLGIQFELVSEPNGFSWFATNRLSGSPLPEPGVPARPSGNGLADRLRQHLSPFRPKNANGKGNED